MYCFLEVTIHAYLLKSFIKKEDEVNEVSVWKSRFRLTNIINSNFKCFLTVSFMLYVLNKSKFKKLVKWLFNL